MPNDDRTTTTRCQDKLSTERVKRKQAEAKLTKLQNILDSFFVNVDWDGRGKAEVMLDIEDYESETSKIADDRYTLGEFLIRMNNKEE